MAQIMNNNENGGDYPDSPCDKGLLLNSLKKHQKNGVVLGVEKIINPKLKNYGDNKKALISVVFTIVGSMEKCILYKLDENGKKIQYEDEITGDKKYKLYVGDGQLKEVIFPFYADLEDDALDENSLLVIKPRTSSYSFFRTALIDGEALPKDAPIQPIGTNFKELKECLEGWEFLAKYELIKGKNRSFPALLCESVESDDDE